jgi:hypothetical protein
MRPSPHPPQRPRWDIVRLASRARERENTALGPGLRHGALMLAEKFAETGAANHSAACVISCRKNAGTVAKRPKRRWIEIQLVLMLRDGTSALLLGVLTVDQDSANGYRSIRRPVQPGILGSIYAFDRHHKPGSRRVLCERDPP